MNRRGATRQPLPPAKVLDLTAQDPHPRSRTAAMEPLSVLLVFGRLAPTPPAQTTAPPPVGPPDRRS